jgi:hypothetical protein
VGLAVALAGASIALTAVSFAATAQTVATGGALLAQIGAADAGVPPYIQAASQGIVKPPDIEDVEHMCALLTSCPDLPFPPQSLPTSVPSCVKAMMDELSSPDAVKYPLSIRECGLVSNSCAQLAQCARRGADPNVCKGYGKSSPVGKCDFDGRAINCFHEEIVGVRECPRGGEQCVVRDGVAGCVLGPCTDENKEGAPPTCSASGVRILRCDRGKLTSLDCAAFGLKCTMDGGNAGCAPPTAACTGTQKRCDGNVSVGCVHGHEVRVDCGATGLTCNLVPGATPIGTCAAPAAPAGPEKCDAHEAPKCEGATIKYCFAGKRRSYFCKSLGFNKCAKDGQTVHCAM